MQRYPPHSNYLEHKSAIARFDMDEDEPSYNHDPTYVQCKLEEPEPEPEPQVPLPPPAISAPVPPVYAHYPTGTLIDMLLMPEQGEICLSSRAGHLLMFGSVQSTTIVSTSLSTRKAIASALWG